MNNRQTPDGPPRFSWLHPWYLTEGNFLWALMDLGFFGVFLNRFGSLLNRLFCSFQVNQGEAINVEFARAFGKGLLYQDPTQGPYFHATYPPLFPFLQGILFSYLPGPWLAGRLLAFAGYMGCGFLLLIWGWKRWGLFITLSLVFLFYLSPTWAAWGSMVRVDTLSLFWEFGAFLLLMMLEISNYNNRKEDLILVAGGILCALAILCKQSGILLWVAYTGSCLLQKRWKRLFLFTAAALIPVMTVFLYYESSSHGFFLKENFLWLSYGYQGDLLIYYLKNSFLRECGWLALGAGLAFKWGSSPLLLRSLMLVNTISLLGLGRITGAENYYLGFILVGLVFVAESCAGPHAHPEGGRGIQSQGVLAGLVMMGFFCFVSGPWPSSPAKGEMAMKQKALEFYTQSGNYLALDPDLPLMAGKSIWIQPAEYTALVSKGTWNPGPLVKDIRLKKFVSIELYDIPRQYLLPQEVEDEIDRSYQVKRKAFGRRWYIPK